MRVVVVLSFLMTIISTPPGLMRNANQNPNPAVEAAKQRYDRLRRADFASIEVRRIPPELNQPAEEVARHFKTNERIMFQIVLTNISNTPISFPIGDNRKQLRPKLIRDGDLVPYRKSLDELLTQKEKEPMFTSAKGATLKPGDNVVTYLDLKDWYEPLKHGHYQLSVKERFIWDGQWVESSSITFEVDPLD
jgi:hypothetical protein